MTKRFELSMYYWFMVGSIIFIIDGSTHNLFPVGIFYFLMMVLGSEGFLYPFLCIASIGFWIYSLFGREERPMRIILAQAALIVSLLAYLTTFPGAGNLLYYFSFVPFFGVCNNSFKKVLDLYEINLVREAD